MFVFLSKTWDLGRPTTLHAPSYAGTQATEEQVAERGQTGE